MVTIKSNFEFDGQDSEELLSVLENLSRDLENIQDRQERLNELSVAMELQLKNGEPVVQLKDTS
ncbi:hypothetical protein DJ71_02365 [Halorubrum sp. E3]|nr:hypothetical protein DJ71_02365 [Halorubrum sp. E3]